MYGWDMFLIDPDNGENVKRKLKGLTLPQSNCDIQSIPTAKDKLWTKELYKAPKISFGTIFNFLVDSKVLIKKAVHVENVMEIKEKCTIEEVGGQTGRDSSDDLEPATNICSLDKAYRYFQNGHVQNVRFHPMTSQPNYICIGANVLPSMKKGKMYRVWIVLSQQTAHVEKAFCICPAGLSGCCNHCTVWRNIFAWALMKKRQKVALKNSKLGTYLDLLKWMHVPQI